MFQTDMLKLNIVATTIPQLTIANNYRYRNITNNSSSPFVLKLLHVNASNINDHQCQIDIDGVYRLINDTSNTYEYKVGNNVLRSNGYQLQSSINGISSYRERLHLFDDGPYVVGVRCDDIDNNCSNSFVIVIMSQFRVHDPIALHFVYRWLASMCIESSRLRMIDADIQGIVKCQVLISKCT
jgi:hypothetical protein